MAATRRPSTSYVLASLRALHVDLLLAGGKAGNDRGRAICAQAGIGWGQNSPNLDPLHVGGANTHRQVGPRVTRRATQPVVIVKVRTRALRAPACASAKGWP